MSEFQLTEGFCAKANVVARSEDLEGPIPVIQILSIKKIAGGTSGKVATDRHRVILSDGLWFMQSMLSTALNEKVDDGTFRRNAVMKLTRWEPQNLHGSRILIIFDMEPVGYPAEKIGNPANVGKPPGSADNGMAVDTPPAAAPTANPATSAPPPPRPAAPAASASKTAEKVGPIFPIEGLNPYHNKWTLKARVISKSEKRKWSNSKGEGQLFSVTLMDETGEIKGTAFNNAVDHLYDVLEEGKVFYITKGKVVLARKNFSTVNNDYEITFDHKTEVTPCTDAGGVPEVQYTFVDLAGLENRAKDDILDVIAVVHKVESLGEIVTKQGKTLSKRELSLVDRSGYACQVTLWGKQAEGWNHHDNPVVSCKGLKLSDFGGRSLSVSASSVMNINPDTPDAHNLRGWYEGEGRNSTFRSFTSGGGGGATMRNAALNRDEMKTLQEVRDADIGNGDKPEYFTSRATILSIKSENIAYPACRGENCNKKVTDSGSGWFCEKCNQSWDKPEYRYLIQMQVTDHTSQAWFQAFNDVGVEIIGKTADELMNIKEEDEQAFNKEVAKSHSKMFNFACRAKQDTYQETTRVRYGVNRIYPLDFAAECRNLHKMLAGYPELIPPQY